MTHRKKLIEVALPLDEINAQSSREKPVQRRSCVGILQCRDLPGTIALRSLPLLRWRDAGPPYDGPSFLPFRSAK